jgi:hypothetical protein
LSIDTIETTTYVMEKLQKCVQNAKVPISLAQRLIKDSAYWYGHQNGPARAPKHYERVTAGPYGWEITFGANSFLVEQAIRRFTDSARAAVESFALTGKTIPDKELRKQLALITRGAVSNYQGEVYLTYWPVTDGHMMFGTQSIHVADFVDSYWVVTSLGRIFRSVRCG